MLAAARPQQDRVSGPRSSAGSAALVRRPDIDHADFLRQTADDGGYAPPIPASDALLLAGSSALAAASSCRNGASAVDTMGRPSAVAETLERVGRRYTPVMVE